MICRRVHQSWSQTPLNPTDVKRAAETIPAAVFCTAQGYARIVLGAIPASTWMALAVFGAALDR